MPVHHISQTGKDLDEAIAYIKMLSVISVDTETSGLEPFGNNILLVQIGNVYQQYVFDVARLGSGVQLLKPILENPTVVKILHNAKFDYKFLKHVFGIEMNNMFDTYLAEQLLQKGRKLSGFSLEVVAEKYTGIHLDKSIRETFVGLFFGEVFSDQQIEYAALDVKYLEQIMNAQKQLITRDRLTRVAKIEMGAIAVTGDMELNGMRIDRTKWLEAENIAKVERDSALKRLDELLKPYDDKIDMFGNLSINYNSPKQLLAILQKAVDPSLESTNENVLKEISHPIVYALLDYRGLEKRITTYGEPFLENINSLTGNIHTNFTQSKTDTGRYASEDPNIQNIPVKDTSVYRDAFVAFDENSVLVDADYSNMELRLLADLSKEPKWLEIFEKNLDMHCEIGTLLLGKSVRLAGTLGPDDPGENLLLRKTMIKPLNFGVSYGMGAKKLSLTAKITIQEAKQLLNKYWTLFPNIKEFFDNFVEETIQNKCIRSPYDDRLRWIEGFDLDAKKDLARIRNMSMNFPMQSGNASITKIALTELKKQLDLLKYDAKIIATINHLSWKN
jgi:DNA polymerase I